MLGFDPIPLISVRFQTRLANAWALALPPLFIFFFFSLGGSALHGAGTGVIGGLWSRNLYLQYAFMLLWV